MPNFTQYRDPTDTTRTPSPVIWADCPTLEMLHDPGRGTHVWDDFTAMSIVDGADGKLMAGQWNVSSSAGVTFTTRIAQDFGVARVADNDADEDGIVIWQEGFARFGPSSADKVWFEARFQVPSVANSAQAFFLGFCETTVAPTSVITLVDATGIPDASEDFVGFWQDDADGDVLESIYLEGGGTRVNVGDAIGPIVAATNYKVGMKYEGGAGTSGNGRLQYFVNGAVVQTLNVTSALGFPDVNHLGVVFAHKTTAIGAITFDIDWIRAAAVGGNT
jgi:hypothetical protein